MTRFDFSSGCLCLDFANTLGDRARPESERLRGYDDVLRFGVEAELLGEDDAAALAARARREPAEAAEAFAAALALRDATYAAFSSLAAGGAPGEAALATVNAALAEALPHLRLACRGGAAQWQWSAPAGSLLAPLRPIVRSAAELLTQGDELVRLRECGGMSCTWLFLDRSRNRSRRWCSMESCGNRAKAHRHYHRGRPEAPAPSGG